jgi:hypothetical protein
MNRNFKQQFVAELGCVLMDEDERLFWIALNPVSTLSQRREAEEKLYDLLRNRGVRVK